MTIPVALAQDSETGSGQTAPTPAEMAMAVPSPETRDWLWRVVIAAFVLVLLAAVAAEIACIFVFPAAPTPQVLLTLFTAAAAFLSGLFAPSPFGSNHTHSSETGS